MRVRRCLGRERCSGVRLCSGLAAWLLFASLLCGLPAAAQQIVIDKPVRAGGLIFFPVVEDESTYYYAPTKARLATGETGKPQFSFLRYVENVRDDETENREGQGGGIVHAVVQLGVTDEELDNAKRELRRVKSDATAAGPVIFKSGKFGLVTSFTEDNGDLTTRVVGLGSAPVLDGSKAAISMQLTKLGAKVLWESFQTATPDISFMFEMEMAGFRAPKKATIEAEFDRIYEHSNFQLGVATTYVQAEITQAMDDLRQEGHIRLTQVGEDEKLDALIQAAYSKLTNLIFSPGAGQQQAQQLAGLGRTRKSALDRASELLEKRRTEVREDNTRIRQENAAALAEVRNAHASASRINAAAAAASAPGMTGAAGGMTAGGMTADAAATARNSRLRDLARRRADSMATHADRHHASTSAAAGAGAAATPQLQEEQALPEFAAVMTYEMKKSRQRGRYSVSLNKYTADTISLRFDENIGDLTRYLEDDAVFRSVNLDDPLYRQREVIASLSGVDDAQFKEYLGFVSLQLRKKHAGGDESFEEARIDRKAFNDKGNRFKLVYGWKGDDDRQKWANYEYRTLWGFEVGATLETPWQKSAFNAIQLAPPFVRRTIDLEADEDPLKEAQVRSVQVQVFSKLGDQEKVERATLRMNKDEFSKQVEFVLPADQTEYEYEIKWRLRGNKTLSSGRLKTDQDVLYVDELPEV